MQPSSRPAPKATATIRRWTGFISTSEKGLRSWQVCVIDPRVARAYASKTEGEWPPHQVRRAELQDEKESRGGARHDRDRRFCRRRGCPPAGRKWFSVRLEGDGLRGYPSAARRREHAARHSGTCGPDARHAPEGRDEDLSGHAIRRSA